MNYKVGDSVTHKYFGKGRVTNDPDSPADIQVDFAKLKGVYVNYYYQAYNPYYMVGSLKPTLWTRLKMVFRCS